MKALKTFILALVAVCAFASADAQIRVRIGGRPYHHRPYYHRHWHRWHHGYRRHW